MLDDTSVMVVGVTAMVFKGGGEGHDGEGLAHDACRVFPLVIL